MPAATASEEPEAMAGADPFVPTCAVCEYVCGEDVYDGGGRKRVVVNMATANHRPSK
jgi:hypothetical protein